MSNLGKMERWSYDKKLSSGERVFFVGSKNAIHLLHAKDECLESWKAFYENIENVLYDVFDLIAGGKVDDAFAYLDAVVGELESTSSVRTLPRYLKWKKKGGKHA